MAAEIPDTDWIYDIETYCNMFSADVTHARTGTRFIFEVSDRIDQSWLFVRHIMWLREIGARMFGFNNEGFDWPVVQYVVNLFLAQGHFTAWDAYQKAQAIIDGERFEHTIWPSDRLVVQGDLYKIHHFDNMARSTSLKKLEINMRSPMVVDLPYSPHVELTHAQKDEVIPYMCHDVAETHKFYVWSLDQILFRDALAVKYPDLGDVLNFNDTKIGKKFFEWKIGKDVCYHRPNGRREPRQTRREQIAIADVISPKVQFQSPEFERVRQWLASQVLTKTEVDEALKESDGRVNTKGVFKDVSANVDGFSFDFGTGGIHGSVERQTVRATETHDLIDVDVASYYPNLAIANQWYPAHLGASFYETYSEVYQMRKQYKKGTAENKMLKLALNGVYGDSNNKWSPFYDPQYTMSITVNGQLYLCMLAEWLMGQTGGKMVQINTDGLTMLVPKEDRKAFEHVCERWEIHTGLELEHVRYSAMHIRDVNSYIAEKLEKSSRGENGELVWEPTSGIKRIGAYAHQTPHDDPSTGERQWHQDHSSLVVRKAAEAAMVDGVDVAEFIMRHRDPYDFAVSVKVPRNSRLMWGEQQIQNTSRYYVSTNGASLTKIMPPLKGKTEERHLSVQKGWTVTPINDMSHFDWRTVNWLYYIEEARKLVI